jgi:apolipoprotein N-acyltransferase
MKNIKSPFVFLAAGGLLMLFSNGRWVIPTAAWLYPAFFLRYMRLNTPKRGLLGLALVSALVNPVIHYGTMPLPKYAYFMITVLVMQLFTLCFWLHRKIGSRLGGFISTLLFPCIWVSMEFITSFFPKATWDVLAYTQAQNLSLAQMVSVTGIWGLSFLVTWFAAVVEWAWSHEFNWKIVKGGVIVFVSCFAIIYLAGYSRVNFISTGQRTVKVAWIVQSRSLNTSLATCKWTDASAIGNYSRAVEANFLAKSKQAADAGAKFILWQEAGGFIPQKEESEFVDEASKLAREEKVNLLLTLWSVPLDFPQHRVQNKLLLIDSNGVMQMNYLKSNPAPPEPILKGDGKIPIFKSDYGNIGAAICFDGDFPAFIRQAGKQKVDLFFLPANDWKQITKMHADMAIMRAIENGFSLIRAAGQGISMMNDNRGRLLARLDYYGSDEQVLVADVPVHRSFTLYPILGDWFGWTCLLALAAMLVAAIRKSYPFKFELAEPSPLLELKA